MPPKGSSKPAPQNNQKRKAPASFDKGSNNNPRSKRQNTQRDARTLAVQTTSKAFKNGELDVDKFVKAREYEIRALEEGLERSKRALTTRAFQQVPKELRRRTASHNASRVPKKLRGRAKQEMADDNTPTVTARKRKPTRHQRLRVETAKKLRALGAKRKAAKDKGEQDKALTVDREVPSISKATTTVKKGESHAKKNKLRPPPIPKAKFRKRQLHKSWLPTHMFHAKRARMTLPKEPLWRFAIPLTPTAKSYRPTHRAASERGAIAWDTSYMATIGLEGVEKSIESLLRALGVAHASNGPDMFGPYGQKWRSGTRTWQGWVFARDTAPAKPIAPATIIWRAEKSSVEGESSKSPLRRSVMLRVHPAAFLQLWEEVVRLCKVQKPQVLAEDLRFEIGSIEVLGPGSTEALQGALWPISQEVGEGASTIGDSELWRSINGIENPSILPAHAMLAFSIQDPRLHHPPRTVNPPTVTHQDRLLHVLAEWPASKQRQSQAIFDNKIRIASSKALPSQKAINRRKATAKPGCYPEPVPQDPRIPILLYTSTATTSGASSGAGHQARWTVLLPWKSVSPVWYSIMYYPLSTGGQVRFGGLREQRQIAFESGMPWFPGDYPGTEAGYTWNEKESARRKLEWERRPKGRRTEYSSLDLGKETKGEVGDGWACDWDRLLNGPPLTNADATNSVNQRRPHHLASQTARSLLNNKKTTLSSGKTDLSTALFTVKVAYLTRGVPSPCARIYRLPSPEIRDVSTIISSGPTATTSSTSEIQSSEPLRDQWLAQIPSKAQNGKQKTPRSRLPIFAKNASKEEVQQRLAADLLCARSNGCDDSGDQHPNVPDEADLIGFITAGEFCLSEGKGVGIGSLLLSKVLENDSDAATPDGQTTDARLREQRTERSLCIVRNAGERLGRLARWEIV